MTAVQFEMSREQQMTLTTPHGVLRLDPVKLQPPRYQRPAAKTSHRTTIQLLQMVAMLLLTQEPIDQFVLSHYFMERIVLIVHHKTNLDKIQFWLLSIEQDVLQLLVR